MQDEGKTNSCLVTVCDVCKYQNKYQSILKTVTYVTKLVQRQFGGGRLRRPAAAGAAMSDPNVPAVVGAAAMVRVVGDRD